MARFSASIVPVLAAVALTGCPDPDSAFESHLDKAEGHLDAAVDAAVELDVGVTDEVPMASGTYLLAVAASADPTKPLLFKAEAVVDDAADPPTLDLALVPLVAPSVAEMDDTLEDRDELPGGVLDPDPVPVTQNGDGQWVFEIEFVDFELPGESDPILPGQAIGGDMTWTGRIATDAVFCGDVDGQLTAPSMVPLAGSTFGVIKTDDVTAPEMPARDCAESLAQ